MRAEKRVTVAAVEWGIFAAATAIAAILAKGDPTGIGSWDIVLRACFIALFGVVGRRLDPRWWIAIGLPALLAMGYSIWLVTTLAAVLLGFVAWFDETVRSRTGLWAGALFAWSLLHTPSLDAWPGLDVWGASAALASILFVVAVLASGILRSISRRWVIGIGVGVVLVGSVGAFVGITTYTNLRDGQVSAQRALSAQRQGRIGDAELHWPRSKASFEDAVGAATGPAARLLTFVPLAAQHVSLAEEVAQVGLDLSTVAANSIDELDYSSWLTSSGKIDVESVTAASASMAALNDVLLQAEVSIQRARSPWVLQAADRRIATGVEELRSSRGESELLTEALRLLPDAMGTNGPKEYLVVFANPAEAREMGGLLSAYALVRFDDGQLSITEAAVNDRLVRELRKHQLENRDDYSSVYRSYDLVEHPLNLTGTPDLSTMASAVQEIFSSSIGQFDGLLYMDPFVLETLIGLGRPLRIPGQNLTLNQNTTADYLMRSQYFEVPEAKDREAILLTIFDEAVNGLGARLFQNPGRLNRELIPLIDARRLQMISMDGPTNALLEEVGLLSRSGLHRDTTSWPSSKQTKARTNSMCIRPRRSTTRSMWIPASAH